MCYSKSVGFIFFLILYSKFLFSQKPIEISGYVSSLQSAQLSDFDGDWLTDNLLHNRINLKYFAGEHLKFELELRNRLIWGESQEQIEGYGSFTAKDNGWMNLSHAWVEGESALLLSKIDRFTLELSYDKWNLTVGRQRINWGRTYVWNCNDIFNSYSFFDFDYVERPGSDALRFEYFVGMASKVELAAKLDADGKVTAAAYGLVNMHGYDLQFLAGILNEQEWALGMGWSGNIWDLGFKGEITYLVPRETWQSDRNNVFLLSAGLEYMFPNQLMLRGEYLFNEAAGGFDDFGQFMYSENSVRNLSFSKHAAFVGADYPITPLFTTSLSAMWMPGLSGFYAGPALQYSLKENLNASVIGQYFNIEQHGDRTGAVLAFLKLQYSF